MRILGANGNHEVVGRAESYHRELIPGLRERGHEVGLLVESVSAPILRIHFYNESLRNGHYSLRDGQLCGGEI